MELGGSNMVRTQARLEKGPVLELEGSKEVQPAWMELDDNHVKLSQARASNAPRQPQAAPIVKPRPQKISLEKISINLGSLRTSPPIKAPSIMDISEGSSNSGDSVDGDDESGPDDEDEFAPQMSDSDLPDTERQPKRKGVKVVSDTKGGKKGKGVQGGRSQSSVIEPDKGSGRQLVDDDHVGKLVRNYRKYMGEFSKGRKKKIKQLIPNKVWLKIFRDYKTVGLPFFTLLSWKLEGSFADCPQGHGLWC